MNTKNNESTMTGNLALKYQIEVNLYKKMNEV